MVTKVDWQEAQRRVTEFIQRAAKGERILVENGDRPVAALVGPDDLRRLEEMDSSSEDEEIVHQRHFRDLLASAGVAVTLPTRTGSPPATRRLISVEGPPLSEQIIADRS
jgi:prevent-host-death family protein